MKRIATSLIALSLTAAPLMAADDMQNDASSNEDQQMMQNDTSSNGEQMQQGEQAANGEQSGGDTQVKSAEAMSDDDTGTATSMDGLIRTRDITGGDVYTTAETYGDADWANASFDSIGDGLDDIGDIEDVVLNRDGKMIGVVAEVGGFLDIADKHVMLKLEDVKLAPLDDGEYAVVTRRSEEELESMNGVDEGWWN